jgi:hypothetical protein
MTAFVDDSIKKPSFKDTYDQDQQKEFVKCAIDPLYFVEKYVKIVSKEGAVPFKLFDYQRTALDNFVNHKHNILLFSRQLGKALAIDTPIITPNGWKTMGDLVEGDFVYGIDGNPTEVILVTDVMYDHDCYEILFDNGDKITADADHLWVVNHENKNITMLTSELYERTDFSSIYINSNKPIEFYPNEKNITETSSRYEFISELLGIVDFHKIKNTEYKITCDNEKMAEDVSEILSSLGIKNTMNEKHDKLIVTFNTNEEQHHYIKSIKKVESVPVKCITVDNPDEMFLCGKTMIPTHNTTLTCAYLLWYAMFHKDKTVLVVAHNLKGAIEILERIKYSYKELPNFIRDAVVEFNKTSMVFKNGSRIVCRATSADASRGLTVNLLYCDELGFLRPSIQSDFWAAIRPTLSSSKGDSILTSTPGNDDDLFANIWRGANDTVLPNGEELPVGKNGYKATFADWRDHPDRDEQWAIDERAAMGEERFLREHENRFINFNTTLIDSMVLERLSPLNHKFTMGEVRWFKAPSPGHSYFVMLDPSLGTKSDWSAIQIIEMPTLEHIGEWSSNTTPPKGQVQILHDILNYIADEIDPYGDDPDIYWSFENNTIGEAILQTIEETGIEYFPGNLVSEKKLPSMKRRFRRGLNTTNKNKLLACSKFKSLVDTERLKPASVGVIKQLKNFTANGASFSAKGSGNDDLVMALILAVRLVEMTKNWEIYDPEILSDSIEHDFREPLPIVFS